MPYAANLEKLALPTVEESSRPPKPCSTAERAEDRQRAMPINILMPALSPTMEEGKLAKWLKQGGRHGHAPATSWPRSRPTRRRWRSRPSTRGGSARSSSPKAPTTLQVNTPIAMLLDDGEDASAIADIGTASRAGPGRPMPSPPMPSPRRPKPQMAAPAPATRRRAAQRCERRADLRLAAGAPHRQGGRRRHPRSSRGRGRTAASSRPMSRTKPGRKRAALRRRRCAGASPRQ